MIKQTIFLGFYALILVSTYESFSTIVTYINQQQGFTQLGPVLLFANFAVFMLTNSFAPSFSITYKTQFIIASICYSVNYLLQSLYYSQQSIYILSVIGACFGGVGASLFWISEGAYMKLLCLQSKQGQEGKYFGILNGFLFGPLVLGAVITTVSIQMFSFRTYYLILMSVGLLTVPLVYFSIKDIQNNPIDQNIRKQKGKISFWMKFKNSLSYFKVMKAVIPILLIDGILIAFRSSLLLHLLPQEDQQDSHLKIGIVLILCGIGSVIGGFTGGYLSDIISIKKVGAISLINVIIVSLLVLISTFHKSFLLGCFCGFLWGITVYFLQGWMMVVCSRIYSGKPQAFATNKQVHSTSFCLTEIIIILTNNNLDIKFVCVFLMLMGFISMFSLKFIPNQNKTDYYSLPNTSIVSENIILKSQNQQNSSN